MPELRYVDESHQYFMGERELPSVTSILQGCGYMKALPFYTKAGSDNGRRRHTLTELYDLETLDWGTVSIEDLPFLQGWIQAKKDLHIEVEPSGIEVRLYHPILGYAGTSDRICRAREQITVIDLKTGAKAKWHVLQLILYGMAYAELYEQPLPKLMSVYLQKNGRYGYKEYDYKDKSYAIAAVRVANWKEKN